MANPRNEHALTEAIADIRALAEAHGEPPV